MKCTINHKLKTYCSKPCGAFYAIEKEKIGQQRTVNPKI
jgi:hypothetical protein